MAVQNPELFALVYNTISADEELTAADRSVLLAIASLMRHQTETVRCSIDATLPKLTGLSRSTVGRTINGRPGNPGLDERGYLIIDDRGVDPQTGKNRPNGYTLNWKLLGINPRVTMTLGSEALESQIDDPRVTMTPGTKGHHDPGHIGGGKEEEKNNTDSFSKNSSNIRPESGVSVTPGPSVTVTPGDDDDLWEPSFPNAVDESPAPRPGSLAHTLLLAKNEH